APHHILVYDDRGRHAGLSGKWTLARVLRRHRFDLAILLQNAFEAAVLAFLAGIPRRYGYATDGRTLLLTDPVLPPPRHASRHQVGYYWDLLKPFGAEDRPPAPQLTVTRQEELAMAARLADAGIAASDCLIGLNPGSTYGAAKRWLPDRYAEVADRLSERYAGSGRTRVAVAILGAKGEEELGRSIAARIKAKSVVCSGQTTVRELMALTKRCQLFLTNDTGPMHIAAAFSVPTVAVFGPTDWRTTAPFGGRFTVVRKEVTCAPCLLRECPIDHRCMTHVTVEDVYEAAVQQGSVGSPASGSLSPFPLSNPQESSIPRSKSSVPSRASAPLAGVTVFLDRDGTLNHDTGFVKAPEELVLLPGVPEALARLRRAGARLIVLTNQSGVGRGFFSLRDLEAIHARLRDVLAQHHVALDGLYYCPHHPDEQCLCRKPRRGMVDQAVADHQVDLSRAYLVGDQVRDIELAHQVGIRSVLVTTGPAGPETLTELQSRGMVPDRTASSLAEAADWILQDAVSAGRAGSELQLSPRE
ncbi:MAG TPA: lipopolysaccharide heptosyltransferase II, partial [Nitrospiraceae bacterium]|nr:lipopolysaccharide heptosyltransferase II [Nitrospiraceae bacterium]